MTTEPTGAIDMHNYEQNAHLPECIALAVRMEYDDAFCICPDLRACEARRDAEWMRLLGRMHVTSDCWLWTGTINPDGYGIDNRTGAHRVVWEHINGPIPDGLEIDHLCRVRNCVRVDHMELVDHKTNTLRGTSPTAVNSVKTECPQGHQYDDGNTYRDKAGKRYCRKCMNAKHKRLRERKKAER